jgi:hypothetical protein
LRRGVGIFKRFNDSAFCAPRRAYTVTPTQYVVLNTHTFYFNKLYLVTLYTLCSYFLKPHTLVPNQPQPTISAANILNRFFQFITILANSIGFSGVSDYRLKLFSSCFLQIFYHSQKHTPKIYVASIFF